MGQTLISMAEQENASVVAMKDIDDSLEEGIEKVQVAIDFSDHVVTPKLGELCVANNIPLVIGTTGHTEEERKRILDCSSRIPIVWAGNYSVGVNTLFFLSEMAAKILGDRYQPEIVEIHHKHKKDAPSGTALNLVESIEKAPAWESASRVYGREGDTGARPDAEIGIHALRGGEVVGEHTVFLFGDDDRIELTHRASDRRIFATGAYRAAHWVVGQNPGLYSMRDVLGLTSSSTGMPS
jgi:4-hydroxy-tetrahydrodipicolinate reductase